MFLFRRFDLVFRRFSAASKTIDLVEASDGHSGLALSIFSASLPPLLACGFNRRNSRNALRTKTEAAARALGESSAWSPVEPQRLVHARSGHGFVAVTGHRGDGNRGAEEAGEDATKYQAARMMSSDDLP